MHIFTKAVTRVLLPGLILGASSLDLKARQQDSLTIAVQDSVRKADAEKLKVTGTLTDASTGSPLDGVRISVEGYSAAISNADGTFTISVPHYNSVLLVSGLGYATKEIPLKGRTNVKSSLYNEGYTSSSSAVNLPFQNQFGSRIAGAVEGVEVNDR